MRPALLFRGLKDFSMPESGYRLLPFRFMEFGPRMLLVNEVGEHEYISGEHFRSFVSHHLPSDSDIYLNLKAKHFLSDSSLEDTISLLATKYRTKRHFLDAFTRLHIFVVTLRCDTSCHYCQVSRVSTNRDKYDMTRDSADRALDLVFRSPAPAIKIEYQGGEPLLNFDLIKYVTLEAKRRNLAVGKDLQFVVTTNLSGVSESILSFLAAEGIWVSTSLDGPMEIHNANRPRPGQDAYQTTIRGIEMVRQAMGHDAVSALMTTTRLSLTHPEEIVNEYAVRGFSHIFLRPLSPYGFAVKTQKTTGYALEDFLVFYKRALGHIIEVNRAGGNLTEVYAQILLTKILTPFATGYVDLQSPAGAGIGAVVYNYDGDVYASDEARMLAEMGDRAFRLGNVHRDTYEGMFGGPLLKSLVASSCVESLPGCSECAFQMYCGADPIENYVTQGDIVGHRPTSTFCGRNMSIIKHLLALYHGEDEFVRRLFWSWVQNVPVGQLLPAVPV
jgi:His-Xaa-Ser system radical SAM maturase HxsB